MVYPEIPDSPDKKQLRKIGAVELLRQRVLPLDATTKGGAEVIVESGSYDLYSDGLSRFWLMRGELNARGFRPMGDSVFAMHAGDGKTGIEVQFPSRTLGPDEWEEFKQSPLCSDDDPRQRLRITENQ